MDGCLLSSCTFLVWQLSYGDYFVPSRCAGIMMSMSDVCLSVKLYISETTQPNITKLFMLLLVMAQSFSDGAVISYVLPVLWMTS